MPVQMQFPQVDFSSLSKLPDAFEQGQQWSRERALREALKTADFSDLTALAKTVGPLDHELALKLAIAKSQQDALAPYRAAMAGSALERAKTPAERVFNWWTSHEDGSAAAPEQSPMQLGPSDPIPAGPNGPTGVPGASYATPSGVDPKLVNAPAAAQDLLLPNQAKEELVKGADLKVKRQEEEPSDWALVNSYRENGGLISSGIKDLVDERGAPNDALKSITGNRHIGNIDTRIPNAELKNITQTARDAHASLETIKTQIGLLQLAAMRAASAQGASGLGQLAIQESQWLQQAVKNLDEEQNPYRVARNLVEIDKHVQRLQSALEYKFKMSHGKEPPVAPDPTTSGMDMATEPLPGDKPVPGASVMTTNPNGPVGPNDILRKANMLLQRNVSKQAIVAALRRDKVPEETIQQFLNGSQ